MDKWRNMACDTTLDNDNDGMALYKNRLINRLQEYLGIVITCNLIT